MRSEMGRRQRSGRKTRQSKIPWLVALALVGLSGWLVWDARTPPATHPDLSVASSATTSEGVHATTQESSAPVISTESSRNATTRGDDAETPKMVIAWQPSHQGDTGYKGWKEYKICGDIVERTIRELPEYRHVKAWDLEHGLTGSNNYRPQPTNTRAFDRELGISNRAKPTVFISIHNDGGATSGILGECMPNDRRSHHLTKALVASLASQMGLKNRGVREVRLYSLEASRNDAPYRCLLEIGDNAADRELLESKRGRQQIAEAIADAITDYEFE